MKTTVNRTAVETLLFFLLLTSASYFHHPVEYDNSKSRYFLISSVVDFGTIHIDAYHHWTLDKSYFNGHYYSNKAPGAQLLGIPVYWLTQKVKSGNQVIPLTTFDIYLVRWITTTLPFAILGVILFRMGCKWSGNIRKAMWMVLAYSFGSIAYLHATLFSGHQIAACFAFFSFSILYSLSKKDRIKLKILPKNMLFAFLSGLFAGLGALADYTAMYIAFILFFYAMISSISKQEKFFFLFGGFICLAALSSYNTVCFGSAWTLSYGHQATEAFKKGSESGILGVSFPSPAALFAILFSPSRGLFFIMPVFLSSVFGYIHFFRQSGLRNESILLFFIFLGYLFINAGFYGWHGGWCFGPRYLVPMLPFLALPMVFSPLGGIPFALLLSLSVFQVGISVIGFPHTPEVINNPITELILPCMRYGYFSQNFGNWIGIRGFLSILPLIFSMAIIMAIIFSQTKQSPDHKDTSTPLNLISLIWAFCIVTALIFYKTTPPKIIHGNRAILLKDAAIMTKSDDLKKSSMYESKLAKPVLNNKAMHH